MNKKISINPELFSMKKTTKSSSQSKTNIHKHLVNKMIKHKNKELLKLEKDTTSDDFSYLSNLSKLRKSKKNKERLNSQNTTNIPSSTTHLSSTTSTIKQAPAFGILKNTGKPTWREFHNKTIKRTDENKVSTPSINITPIKTKLNPILVPTKLDNKAAPNNPEINPINKPNKKKPKTYKLGKFKNKVSILIKNRKTRKKITDDKKILEQASLKEIKEYLKKRNLYKSGSNAPSYILKQTYVNSNLSGDIKNLSDKTLLHNYIST